jgi:hypothetical protein
MNAMEILRNEINKKRKLASDLIEKSRETSGEGDGEGRGAGNVETIVDGSGREKKIRYFRQSDLMKEKERVAIEKNLELESKKQEQQRRRLEDEEEREERGKLSGRDENEESEKKSIGLQTAMLNNLSLLTVDEIKHRLRRLGHPVTLFGESPMERIQRLVTAQLDEEDDNTKDEYRLTAIGHDTNHHSHQDDQHHHSLLRKKSEQKGAQAAAAEDEEDDEEEKDQSNSSSYIRGNICTNYSSPSSGLSEEKVIYKYFRNLLKQWEWDLDDREDYLKQTAKGKMETKTQKQCKDYIRPLFKLCKKKEVPGDILIKLGKVLISPHSLSPPSHSLSPYHLLSLLSTDLLPPLSRASTSLLCLNSITVTVSTDC